MCYVYIKYYVFQFLVPVNYVTPLKDVDVKEGETAVLSCEVNKAEETAVWCKDGEQITPQDGKYTITVENYTHTLCISDCDINDDAEYTITIDDHTSAGNVFVEGMGYMII